MELLSRDASVPPASAGDAPTPRVFLLSPANCRGRRAGQLLAAGARSELAAALRGRYGAALGDVFSFVSGLYFRGKLAYACRFAAPPPGGTPGVYVITPNAGLRSPDTRVRADRVRAFAAAEVDAVNPGYRRPLERSARRLRREIGDACDVVLLGSIASPKYVAILAAIFGERLSYPVDFVGRGDMSRGGLLLRRVREGVELDYAPVAGAVLRGVRPPRLPQAGSRSPVGSPGSACPQVPEIVDPREGDGRGLGPWRAR
jgi:hypothetical protein